MKNASKFNTIYTGLIVLMTGILGACDDGEQYDFQGEDTNRVYFNVGNYTVNSYNGYSFSIIHTPAGSFGEDIAVSFPVRCTMGATTDTKVTIQADNSLVEVYNNLNGTGYSALPEGFAELNTSTLTIAQGKLSSSDSLKVSIPGDKFALLTEPVYLLPVKITAIDNSRIRRSART